MIEIIQQHWSHGPHYQFSDSIIFITWRLAFTLPTHLIELFNELSTPYTENKMGLKSMKEQNLYLFNKFCEYDLAMGNYKAPGFSLNEPAIAKIVKTALHYFDAKKFNLHAYVIMSNHVHIVLQALQDNKGLYFPLSGIVQSLKSYTAGEINKLNKTKGQVWDHFYFDRIIRNYENYSNVVNYILNNPVKAGLVDYAGNWTDNYFNEKLVVN